MSRDVRAFLDDMVEAGTRMLAFTDGMSFEEFQADERTKSAVEREIFVMGEAAKNVPAAIRDAHPAVPWREMAKMRDFLGHSYFNVEPRIVWEVATQKAAGVVVVVQAILVTSRDPKL